jgi:hypothetical protein
MIDLKKIVRFPLLSMHQMKCKSLHIVTIDTVLIVRVYGMSELCDIRVYHVGVLDFG